LIIEKSYQNQIDKHEFLLILSIIMHNYSILRNSFLVGLVRKDELMAKIKKILSLVCFIVGIIAFYVSSKFSSPTATAQTDKLFAILLLVVGCCMVFIGINILIPKSKFPRGER